MVRESRLRKLEEKILRPGREPKPDLSNLDKQELRRLVELVDCEKPDSRQQEELNGYYKKITYPDTEEWRSWKDELMEGGLPNDY